VVLFLSLIFCKQEEKLLPIHTSTINTPKKGAYELVTGMDFGSEMLSVDHADISKRDIGNNLARLTTVFFG
jgi:hypothetical protein